MGNIDDLHINAISFSKSQSHPQYRNNRFLFFLKACMKHYEPQLTVGYYMVLYRVLMINHQG